MIEDVVHIPISLIVVTFNHSLEKEFPVGLAIVARAGLQHRFTRVVNLKQISQLFSLDPVVIVMSVQFNPLGKALVLFRKMLKLRYFVESSNTGVKVRVERKHLHRVDRGVIRSVNFFRKKRNSGRFVDTTVSYCLSHIHCRWHRGSHEGVNKGGGYFVVRESACLLVGVNFYCCSYGFLKTVFLLILFISMVSVSVFLEGLVVPRVRDLRHYVLNYSLC